MALPQTDSALNGGKHQDAARRQAWGGGRRAWDNDIPNLYRLITPCILVMVTNPEPNEVCAFSDCHCAEGGSHAGRPVASNISEPQRRVSGIRFQEIEVPASRSLHRFGQFLEELAEAWVRPVHLKGLEPAIGFSLQSVTLPVSPACQLARPGRTPAPIAPSPDLAASEPALCIQPRTGPEWPVAIPSPSSSCLYLCTFGLL